LGREPEAVAPKRPEPAPPRERYVTHSTFGRGRVVETHHDASGTKLVIDFDTVGRKILLERFVTDA
jgi:hypothetical protein